MELLPDRLPWYVAGTLMGLCVVALYALANHRLGVTTSYYAVTSFLLRRPKVETWRVWFFVGLAAGALLVTFLRGGPNISLGYGVLGLALSPALLIPFLFMGGVLMGFGARWSGGCTSGHGIAGTSSLSPASFAATATFMATAILGTFILFYVLGSTL